MTLSIECLRVFSTLCFIVAGVSCLRSPHMEREFERYGLSRFRRLTGSLQLMGAAGLVVGFFYSDLTSLAAAGLSLLMLMGVTARLRVRDSLLQVAPAALMSISNLILLSLSVASA